METYTKKNNVAGDVVVCVYADDPLEKSSLYSMDASTPTYTNGLENGLNSRHMQGPRPTVLLLGWYASSTRNLAKYTSVYREMGYNTVTTSSPTSVTFSVSHTSTLPFLLSILRVLAADTRLLAGGLVFASFSNAGAILFPHVTQLFRGPDGVDPFLQQELGLHPEDIPVINAVRKATAAIVFDSSPCYLHAEMGANALISGLGLTDSCLAHIARAGFHVLARLQVMLFGDIPAKFWRQLRSAVYPCPEMYIYSTADCFLDHMALDELIAYRKQNGLSKHIEVWRVEDAPHVQILRVHPSQYAARLREMNEWGINAFRRRNNLPEWEVPSPL